MQCGICQVTTYKRTEKNKKNIQDNAECKLKHNAYKQYVASNRHTPFHICLKKNKQTNMINIKCNVQGQSRTITLTNSMLIQNYNAH